MVVESLGRIKYEALSGERDRVQSRISAITVAPKKSDNLFYFRSKSTDASSGSFFLTVI